MQMNTIGKRSSDHVNQTSGSSKRQRDFAEVEVTAEDSEEFDAFTNKSGMGMFCPTPLRVVKITTSVYFIVYRLRNRG